MANIADIIDTFQSLDEQLRLEVLLDYADKLPAPPENIASKTDPESARVHECMTPVWLWVASDNDDNQGPGIRLYAKIGEEAPTLRGIVSVIAHGYRDAPATELAQLPNDLVQQLGLGGVVRMNRLVGLNAMIQRVRREASALNTPSEGHTQ